MAKRKAQKRAKHARGGRTASTSLVIADTTTGSAIAIDLGRDGTVSVRPAIARGREFGLSHKPDRGVIIRS